MVSHAAGTLTHHPQSHTIRIEEGHVQRPGGREPATHPLGNIYANALLLRLAGGNETLFGILLCAIGSVIPLLMVSLAALLLPPGSRKRDHLAGWLAAFFPPLVLLSATWRYMLVPVVFALLHLLCALRKPIPPWRWSLSTGASGLALLVVRPDFFLAGAFVGLARKTAWLWRLAVVLVPLGLGGIQIRMVAGDFTPWGGSPYPWANLDQGNNPRAREAFAGAADIESVWAEALQVNPSPWYEPGHGLRRRVFEFISGHPQAFVELLVLKFARIFEVSRDNPLDQKPAENMAYTGALLFTLLLSLVGFGMLVSGAPARSSASAFLWAFLGYAVPWTVFFSLDRMRVPFQALWIVLTAYALDEVWTRRQTGGERPPQGT